MASLCGLGGGRGNRVGPDPGWLWPAGDTRDNGDGNNGDGNNADADNGDAGRAEKRRWRPGGGSPVAG